MRLELGILAPKPRFTLCDQLLCGFGSLFLSPGRIRKVALALRLSTLLAFHRALVRRKYRWLFSSTPRPRKPGSKRPVEALIQAIVELKSRNPRFICPRIARIVSQTFGLDIDKNTVYRVLSKHDRPASGGNRPSWLALIGPHQRQPLERGPLSMRVDRAPELLGARGREFETDTITHGGFDDTVCGALSKGAASIETARV